MRTSLTVTVRAAGREADVQITAPADTSFGRVCRGLGLPPGGVHVDGSPADPDSALIDSLTPGAILTDGPPTGTSETPPRDASCAAISGGLHAGRSVALDPGHRVLVGRSARADLRVACPTVSPEHAVLSWPPTGPLISDAGSTNGVADPDGHRHPEASLDPARELRLGAARLRLTTPPDDRLTLPPPESLDGRRTFDRPLVPAPTPASAAVAVPAVPAPTSGPSPFSWALFLGPLAIGAAMAVLMSPLMAAFALLSPVMVLASWLEGRRRERLGRRRLDRRLRGDLAAFALALDARRAEAETRRRADHPDPAELVRRAHAPARTVWARRPGHPAWLKVRIGTGRVTWCPPLLDRATGRSAPEVTALLEAAGELVDVPVILPAGELSVVGLVGARFVTCAVVRSIVVDAATHHGPADLGIVVDTDRPEEWTWSRWLPHLTPPDPEANRHLIVVCDRANPLRPGTVGRSALDKGGGRVTVVVLADLGEELPDRCDVVVRALDLVGSARVEAGEPAFTATQVLLDGLDHEVAESASRALARLRDPEHEPTGGLPRQIRLSEVLDGPLDRESIRRRWAASDPARLDLVLGVGPTGAHLVDLVAAGPHVLVGGTTGAGKSELLRTLVASLAIAHPPDQVSFVLIDYKGGSAFDACADLPHTVGLVTDLDGRLGDRAIRSLDAEIRRREQVLRVAGHDDLTAHAGHAPALARLIVVVDEFAALARDLPEVLDALVDVARRGRSLGIHLVLATQRPTGVVSEQIRTNTNLRIALRMIDPGDSTDVIGDGSATHLATDAPGRAIVRHGAAASEVQVACVSLPAPPGGLQVRWLDPDRAALESEPDRSPCGPTDLETLVAATGAAWGACTDASPARAETLRRPWLEPLPTQAPLSDLPDDATFEPDDPWVIGVADDPDRQRRVPVRWHPDEGPLVVFALPGSGGTTTLRTVVRSGVRHLEPSRLHVYVVGAPDEWHPAVGHLPHLGRIVEPGDGTRLERLLDMARAAATTRAPTTRLLLVLDDLRSFLDAVDRQGGVGLVDEVISLLARPAPGLAVAASADRVGAVPGALAAVARKLCLRLSEPYDYVAFGLRPVDVRSLPAGRGFDASTGLEFQVGSLGACPHRAGPGSGGPRPDPLDVLPALLNRHDLPVVQPADGEAWTTTLGLSDHPRLPVVLHLARGDHLLVAGPAGSGRSTTLAALASGADRFVVSGAPRSPLRTGAETAPHWCPVENLDPGVLRHDPRPHLLLVDDADLVDDVDGRLAGLVAEPGSVRVVAAVHPDRVRVRYQHWTDRLTGARWGLALQPRPQDAEIWAAAFPTRQTAAWPPGRGYVIEHGRPTLVQVARP